jgi:hypothetical protein
MLPKKDGFDVCRELRHAGVTSSCCSRRAWRRQRKCWGSNWAPTIT